jgi:hypothetical protein
MSISPFIPPAIFFILCITVSYPVHNRINSLLLGSLYSSIIIVFAYQIIGFFLTGYIDPFFLIASVVILLASFPVSLVIGWFVTKRKKGR